MPKPQPRASCGAYSARENRRKDKRDRGYLTWRPWNPKFGGGGGRFPIAVAGRWAQLEPWREVEGTHTWTGQVGEEWC